MIAVAAVCVFPAVAVGARMPCAQDSAMKALVPHHARARPYWPSRCPRTSFSVLTGLSVRDYAGASRLRSLNRPSSDQHLRPAQMPARCTWVVMSRPANWTFRASAAPSRFRARAARASNPVVAPKYRFRREVGGTRRKRTVPGGNETVRKVFHDATKTSTERVTVSLCCFVERAGECAWSMYPALPCPALPDSRALCA
jgi:hypothetical protein